MNEQNNLTYEEEWAKAFDNAEIAPSEAVWSKVELSIAKSSNAVNRKRLLFFKLLAAASVSFAAVVGTSVLYSNYFKNTKLQSSSNSTTNELYKESLITDNQLNTIGKNNSEDEVSTISQLPADYKNQLFKNSNDVEGADKPSATNSKFNSISPTNEDINKSLASDLIPASRDQNTIGDEKILLSNNNGLQNNSLSFLERIGLDLTTSEPDMINLQMVPWYSYSPPSADDEKSKNSLWTGLAMSAGNFNPNSGGSSESAVQGLSFQRDGLIVGESDASAVRIGEERPGSSLGIGLNFGAQLSKKMVLLSGVNYLQQTTNSTSNLIEDGSVVSSYYGLESLDNATVTNNYEIENAYRSVSIPIQAGYYLLNKKIGIMMLAGFSNDFFINKKSIDLDGDAARETFRSDTDGYSLYSIGGLLGTQFSYQMGQNYTIALQPQFKHNLNSFTPNFNNSSSFEIGFRFNYLLK